MANWDKRFWNRSSFNASFPVLGQLDYQGQSFLLIAGENPIKDGPSHEVAQGFLHADVFMIISVAYINPLIQWISNTHTELLVLFLHIQLKKQHDFTSLLMDLFNFLQLKCLFSAG